MTRRNGSTIEINVSKTVYAVTFTANSEYLVSGDSEGVRVWRMEDGQEVATMKVKDITCLAVSVNGRLIAAGTYMGEVFVWNTNTNQQVLSHYDDAWTITGVDFSPDSTRLVVASRDCTAYILDIATRQRVLLLDHESAVCAAKYSPLGDRIVTASSDYVRVYDSSNGRLLVDIEEKFSTRYHTGLLWFDNNLFVISDRKIKRMGTSTKPAASEWLVPQSHRLSCIALSKHGEFIAHSAKRSISFWDTATHAQLGLIQHSRDIRSIAVSPDGRFLAIGGEDGKISIVNGLSRITEPEIRIDDTALHAWKHNKLPIAEGLLTVSILESLKSQHPIHYILASRALVNARLQRWDVALIDATESVNTQPTVIGYIAKSVALAGNGEKHRAYRACDIALQRFHSTHINFLLLIKALIVFLAGEYDDAISRIDDLIESVPFNSICHVVQAYMCLHLGKLRMESGDYKGAIKLFERARIRTRYCTSRTLWVVSLISGWEFDELDITIRQRHCEALYATGRIKEAGESLLSIINTFDEELDKGGPIVDWVSDFTQQCLSVFVNVGVSQAAPHDSHQTSHTDPVPLLREWAKAKLTQDTWRRALVAAASFPFSRVTVYWVLCERLEIIDRTTDAVECFHEMMSELGEEVYMSIPMTEWICDFTGRRLSTLEDDDEMVSTDTQDVNTLTLNAFSTPLLREWAKAKLTRDSWEDALVAATDFKHPSVAIYQVICECLETIGCIKDALECFHEMMSGFGDIYLSRSVTEWVCDFTQRRLSTPGNSVDVISNVIQDDDAPMLRATLAPLLRQWAKAKLIHSSWKDALLSAVDFSLPRVVIYRVICERLEIIGHTTDVVECFHRMADELGENMSLHDKHLEWSTDFSRRFSKKLERLGDTAVNAQLHDEAISHYTVALSLSPPSPQGMLIKRGKTFMAAGSWKQALDDANQVVALDPSSPWGYEMRYAALHKAGDYDNAVRAFEAMLSKIALSPDPGVQRHGDQYVSPSSTRAMIRRIVQRTIRRSPRVLINTITGRLYSRAEQASVFESLPIFKELVSSMATRIDYVHIKREVRQFFRYVMFSHKWEDNEPLFQQVLHTTVYDLEKSPTHDKLQTFCKIVRDDGFEWAWSDTCCIDKSDHFVLQEALVAMFEWYQSAAMTIVFLRGVRSLSQLGALVKSIWNTRAWTLQEYIASKVIHFYTEDWTLYLNLQLPNHKESPEVISEMEEATGVSAERLMALRPGLTNIREKLCLASTRQTMLVEDAAYSLLGIFLVTGLPAIYGEGESSLGRLLAHVLTGSGDASVLAWIGESSRFNSCLPAHITVFRRPTTSHLPSPIPDAEMERIVTASHAASLDLDTALSLYDCLSKLPAPWFAASRMKLPCIAFQLPSLTPYRTRSGRVYVADTSVFGRVKIKTRYDLSRAKTLYLIHPWLDSLLEQEDMHGGAFTEDDNAPNRDEEQFSDEEFNKRLDLDSLSLLEPELPSHPVAADTVPEVPMDKETQARRLVARLRQSFGALLVTPTETGRRATLDYRRVAADSLITVQFQESVSLAEILDNVRTLDVL